MASLVFLCNKINQKWHYHQTSDYSIPKTNRDKIASWHVKSPLVHFNPLALEGICLLKHCFYINIVPMDFVAVMLKSDRYSLIVIISQ